MADEAFSTEDVESLSGILGEADESFDREAWDREGWSEERNPRYRSAYGRRGALVGQPSRVTGIGGASVAGPGGRSQIRFAQPVASRDSVDKVARELTDAVKRVDRSRDRDTATLDKKVAGLEATLKKTQQQAQQMMLLPLLLTKAPQLTSVKLAAPAQGSTYPALGENTELKIKDATFVSDSNNMLLLVALMAMGGGLGSGSSGSGGMDSSMMLVLALAMSGGLGGTPTK